MEVEVRSHSLTHSLTHLLTHPLTRSLTHSLTHSGVLSDDEREKYETGKKLITLNVRQETLNAEIAGSTRKLSPMHNTNNNGEDDDGSA